MEPSETIENPEQKPLHVAIGVFENSDDMSRVAASIKGPEVEFQRVSLSDPSTADDIPKIVYAPIENIEAKHVNDGVKTGGMIGFSTGLIAAIPAIGTGVFFAAPLAGLLAGAWIGGVAGVDEAHRGERLPSHDDYEKLLEEGKGLLVISGDEQERGRIENEMRNLGAVDVHQHPPLHEFVRQYD